MSMIVRYYNVILEVIPTDLGTTTSPVETLDLLNYMLKNHGVRNSENELMELIGDYLEECVLERVRKARFFSILAEECRDRAGETKLSLFFRCVWKVFSSGAQFLHCKQTTGQALFQVLMGGEGGGYCGRKKIPLGNGRERWGLEKCLVSIMVCKHML